MQNKSGYLLTFRWWKWVFSCPFWNKGSILLPSVYLAASSKMDKSEKRAIFKNENFEVLNKSKLTAWYFHWSYLFHRHILRFVSDSITIAFEPFVSFATHERTSDCFTSWASIFRSVFATNVTGTHFIRFCCHDCHVKSLKLQYFKIKKILHKSWFFLFWK